MLRGEQSAMYGLKFQAQCIESVLARESKHQFLVGTRAAREKNELHLIEFDEYNNELVCQALFPHDEEIWSVASSPSDAELAFTTYYSTANSCFQTTLWRLTQAEGKAPALEKLLDIKTRDGAEGPTKVVWNALEGSTDSLMLLDGVGLRHMKLEALDDGYVLSDHEASLLNADMPGLTTGCWDPHHANHFVSCAGTSIHVWDTRSNTQTQHIKQAHRDTIMTIDYNPNKPYHIATAGKDRTINIWDLRHAAKPLKQLYNHTHDVTGVQYNRFHDQLIVSVGADSRVNLWKVVSISSAPLGELEDPLNQKEGDRLVEQLNDHEESVCGVAWSCCDAWMYASVSYDGRVVVNHVPRAEKYKILL